MKAGGYLVRVHRNVSPPNQFLEIFLSNLGSGWNPICWGWWWWRSVRFSGQFQPRSSLNSQVAVPGRAASSGCTTLTASRSVFLPFPVFSDLLRPSLTSSALLHPAGALQPVLQPVLAHFGFTIGPGHSPVPVQAITPVANRASRVLNRKRSPGPAKIRPGPKILERIRP